MCACFNCNTVSYIVLVMMSIYVMYKCLSLKFDQHQDLGKPSLKQPSQAIGAGICWASYLTW
jgi:hypothetical protein